MSRRTAVGFLALAALALLARPFALGQQDKTEVERKVSAKVTPVYPDLARRMNLRGTVKIGVVIAPSGAVKSTRVIGGNPVLVTAAVDAVRKWKYEPAAEETSALVELKFDPH